MFIFLFENADLIFQYTLQHFQLVFLVMFFSICIWIPIGVFMSKNIFLANIIITISNILYCIPSIAMFAILITIPFMGLGRKSSILALLLYSMMPMTRSVYTGIKNVDPKLIEAVRGLGMNKKEVFWEVEFPLALPSIFSGFRIMTIMIISASTIATYIGEKNLGRLIAQGLSRNNMDMIKTGALMVSIVALSTDFLLLKFEDYLFKNKLKRG